MATETKPQHRPVNLADEYPWIIAVTRWFTERIGPGLERDRSQGGEAAFYVGPDLRRYPDKHAVRGWSDPFAAVAWLEAHRDCLPVAKDGPLKAWLCYRGAV